MIQQLTGKYQKHIAVFLFFIFYAELLGGIYAANHSTIGQIDHTTPYPGIHFFSNQQPVEKTKAAFNAEQPAIKIIPGENTFSPVSENNKQESSNDIGGPGQPEMSTFKSVGADNMVNLFTGDFS